MLRRTAGGKMVDINALISKNEKVRAVGNMKANARGDIIDSQGRVVKSINERVNDSYSKTVGNKSANIVNKKPGNSQPIQKLDTFQKAEPIPELTKEELELHDSSEDEEIEIAKIKKKENNNVRK